MENPIKSIYQFNKKAGLLDKGYNDYLESSFQIEEALEGFDLGVTNHLWPFDATPSAKQLSRLILVPYTDISPDIADVDRLDKACDAVVFAVGSMAKLGLNPQQITKALNVVMVANNSKLDCPKDEHGKLMKPDDFDTKYAPEPKLQAILNERS